MRVFVAGGTGHSGSYIIPELIAAGHEVTGLARSDTAAAAVSALGAKVRRGDLRDLEGLMEAAADSDGVIHVAHRQDLLPFGGMDAVSAAPSGVLPRHPDDQRPDRSAGGRPSWPASAGVVPFAGNEVTVPAQERGRGDRSDREDPWPPAAAHQPGQRRKPEPVGMVSLNVLYKYLIEEKGTLL